MAKTSTNHSIRRGLRLTLRQFTFRLLSGVLRDSDPRILEIAALALKNGQLKTGSFVGSIKQWDDLWNIHFRTISEQMAQTPPQDSVLCAFGSVADRTLFLDPSNERDLRKFHRWVEHSRHDFAHVKPLSDPGASVSHPDDIIILLKKVFADRQGRSAGGKAAVTDQVLRTALLNGGFPAQHHSLGGLAAVAGDTLTQLGVRAFHYSAYHASPMARYFSDTSSWLDLNAPEPLSPVHARSNGRADHPVRHGIAIAYRKGRYPGWLFGQKRSVTSSGTDRQLLVLRSPIGSRNWSGWSFDGVVQPTPTLADDWPNTSAFVTWAVENKTLKVSQVPESWLDSLGKTVRHLVLSAPQLGDFAAYTKNTSHDTEPLRKLEILREQLRRLQSAGVCVHLELSGAATGSTLEFFGAFLKDTVDSIGVNADELPGYARLAQPGKWKEPHAGVKDKAAPSAARYRQAQALAAALGVERLYVHGNDVDIILRRGTTLDAMLRDAKADIFAKAVVVIATKLRNPPAFARELIPDFKPSQRNRRAVERVIKAVSRGKAVSYYGAADAIGVFPRPGKDGYWGAIVPCFWFDEDHAPSLYSSTGAGDITSAISFVYSGFCETGNDAQNALGGG